MTPHVDPISFMYELYHGKAGKLHDATRLDFET